MTATTVLSDAVSTYQPISCERVGRGDSVEGPGPSRAGPWRRLTMAPLDLGRAGARRANPSQL